MKQLSSIIFFFLLCHTYSLYSQTDNVGSGRAISFNGITDYIDFGDRYSDLKFPFTVSAWVYLNQSVGSAPIFVSRNNNPVYNGFWFMVNADFIFVEYGDGLGGNNPAFRRGKIASATGITGRWNHVTAVVKDVFDIDLYLNGVNITGSYTGDSNSPMASNAPGGHSTAAYFLSNGVTYRGNAIIDDIRIWNRSLSQEEIRQTMCVNLTGNESGLIGYWDFNETSGATVFDKSSNKFNGQFVGSPQRVFSGAPIGDVSTYLYSTNWLNGTLSLQDGDHQFDVKNIKGNVSGVQVYEVKDSPSQTVGLGVNYSGPYFGVFLVSQDPNVSFDAEYYFKGNGSCSLFIRDDNSQSLWGEFTSPITGKLQRGEILKGFGGKAKLELGVDKVLCDQSSYVISTEISDPEFTFQWNTGESTSSILVNQSGLYSVKVFRTCDVLKDSVTITFSETLKLRQNVITPNGDGKNDYYIVDDELVGLVSIQIVDRWGKEMYYSALYDNTWNGDGFSSGVYYVILEGACGEKAKSPLTIMR